MSFEIKARELTPEFIKSVSGLTKVKLPFKHSWRLKTLASALDKALDSVTESYTEIIKENSILDDKGNLVPNTFKEDIKGPDGAVIRKAGDVIQNSYTPKEEGSEELIKNLVEELMDSPLKIDQDKLAVEALENIEITSEELDVIEPIIDFGVVKDNVVRLKK